MGARSDERARWWPILLALGAGAVAFGLGPLRRRGARAHPDLGLAAAVLPREIISRRTLPLVRAATGLLPDTGDVEVVRIDERVSVRVHRPAAPTVPGPAMLWIHGGGYVIGSARQDDELCRRFARDLGIVVVAVEYRLAPEHPYPAPLEDCHTALEWLARQPGIDPGRLAIGGASAGGGLAAALALAVRDRGGLRPALQLLVYPMLDDRSGERDDLDVRSHRLWSRTSNRFGWSAYLGAADPAVAVPARQEDLSGLPPAWIGVGSADLFHAEDLEYAQRLRAAGVDCEVVEVDGAFHGFDLVLPGAGVSRTFFADQCAALRAALLPAP